jgi:hypothetical protein
MYSSSLVVIQSIRRTNNTCSIFIMSLQQRLSRIQDIVFNKRPAPSDDDDDDEPRSKAKRQRLVAQVLQMHSVQRTMLSVVAVEYASTTIDNDDATDHDKAVKEEANNTVKEDEVKAEDTTKEAEGKEEIKDEDATMEDSREEAGDEDQKKEDASATENDDEKDDPAKAATGAEDVQGNVSSPPPTIQPDSILREYANHYLREQFATMEEERLALEAQRIATLQKCSTVWKTYLYGLTRISNLSDLRDAPDAIMPNNF